MGKTTEGKRVCVACRVDTMELSRRGFTTLSAGLGLTAVLPVPERVDGAHVRSLQEALAQLRDQDPVVGGGAVLPQALGVFAHARRMLDESDYPTQIGQQLLMVTADLGIQGAWLAHDADRQMLARQLYGEAMVLADSAGDSTQRVQLYTLMAQQCSYLAGQTGRKGFAREAMRFAVRAAPGLRGAERMAALETECERLVALGATRQRRVEPEPLMEEGFIVMADPEGNEFCLD